MVMKFSFTIFNRAENEAVKLKEWLDVTLGGKIIKWDSIKGETNECTTPDFGNKIINVEYDYTTGSKEREISRYVNLLYHFSSETFDQLEDPLYRSWLSIIDDKSFMKERYHYHELQIVELCFGTLVSSSNYLCHHRIVSDEYTSCSVDFFHDIRQMIVHCVIFETNYELKIDYMDIKFVIGTYQTSSECYTTILYLYLCNPPIVYADRNIGGNLQTVRCLTLSSMDVDVLGRSRVLCLKISSEGREEGHSLLSRLHARCNNMPIHYTNMLIGDKVPYISPNVDLGHFGSSYILQGIFRRSYFVLEFLKDQASTYIAKLKEFAKSNPDSLEKTLIDILEAIDDAKVFDVWTMTLKLYTWHMSNEKSCENYLVPHKTKLVRRLIITPTRWLYWPADIINENRILRNFSADHTIRVTFRDENYNRLPSVDCEYSVYQEAVKKPLTEGLIIGKRKYEFLAWSNSQLREHSVWMYAKDNLENNAISIRSWMGKFSSIKTVGKYMARMGQCFSQSEDTVFVPLEENSVQTEDDKTDGCDPMTGKPYCFSDGVGKISKSLTEKVCNVLGLKKTYSAFQIRYSGYKGMLTMDPLLNNLNIVFRKSMLKFECPESTRLEVVKVSNSGPLQLNRPLVTIMDQMGVPHNVFLKMQTEMLINMIEMFLDDHKAAEYLSLYCSTPYLTFRDMCDAGFSLTTEPFFHLMLLAIHRKMTWGIKAKAHIDIDPSEGRNMFGVMDEYRKLKYGQVFVQYTMDINSRNVACSTTILTGQVLVTKNPCLQPGDIRMLEAVDVPDLHHIVDCIVFPQFGKRPHPNEMGGSDLDGDEYTVIWKKELFFQNSVPRHFPAYENEQKQLWLSRPVTVTDMISFFVDFIKNDQLGIIGIAHLVQADLHGLYSSVCENIAEKYSVAVDFPKTGLKRKLDDNEKPQEYPDFMQKKNKRTYKSSRALGKMFRACQFMVRQEDIANYTYENIQADHDLIYPGWENYYKSAEVSKHKYIQYVKYLMQHYGIQHEAELISGCFTRVHGRHREYQLHKREVEEILSKSVRTLWKNMRREFLEEFMKSDSDDDMVDVSAIHSRLLQKASAWYLVTYNDKNSKYLSFPWIVTDYLIKVKLEKMEGYVCHETYGCSLSRLDSILQEENVIHYLPELNTRIVEKFHGIKLEVEDVVFHTAVRLIIKWAYKVKIIYESDTDYVPFNKMSLSTLIDIFIEAMYSNGFICKPHHKPIKMRKNQKIGPSLLCACFFRFSILLRNTPNDEIKSCFPFILDSYKILAKRAAPAYQCLVLSNFPKIFGISTKTGKQIDEEMEPVFIENDVFAKSVLQNSPESFAIYNLQRWSGVKDIQMRKAKKHFIVTAAGPITNILILQQILNKDTNWLKRAFSTGNIPEKYQIKIQQS